MSVGRHLLIQLIAGVEDGIHTSCSGFPGGVGGVAFTLLGAFTPEKENTLLTFQECIASSNNSQTGKRASHTNRDPPTPIITHLLEHSFEKAFLAWLLAHGALGEADDSRDGSTAAQGLHVKGNWRGGRR